MKKIIVAFIFAVFSTGLTAQNIKIGHIDSYEVIQAMPELKEAQNTLQKFAKELEDAMAGMTKELQDKYKDYQAKYESLSAVIRKSREDELQDLQRRIELFRSNAQVELQQKEHDLQQPIIDKVQQAIEEVGRENNFTYILDAAPGNGILYKSPSAIDVTPLVKKKLKLE